VRRETEVTVGQLTTKQTWLLDNVEITGIVVRDDGQAPGSDIGNVDDFNLQVDANYAHLAMHYNTDRASIGQVHCETYPLPASQTNDDVPWPLPTKPSSQAFEVFDPAISGMRPLKDTDHIRMTGRWTIDKHPEDNITNRHFVARGHVHLEFHPIRYDTLEIVIPPAPRSQTQEVVSIAAPLFDEVYLSNDKWFGNWFAAVGSKVYISGDPSTATDWHPTVTAVADIFAPPLEGQGWTGSPNLISWSEKVLVNGTSEELPQLRTVTVADDHIHIVAAVTAPPLITVRGIGPQKWLVADINGPAQGLNVLQLQYTVKWKPRLQLPNLIAIPFTPVGLAGDFGFSVTNIGPDPVTIADIYNIDWQTEGGPDPEFTITTPTPVVVPPSGTVDINGTFAPVSVGEHQTTLMLDTNDPGFGPTYELALTGIGTQPIPPP
jgi:hypothetical protein